MNKTVEMYNMYCILVYITENLLLKPCDTSQWVTLKYYSGWLLSKLHYFKLFWSQQFCPFEDAFIIILKIRSYFGEVHKYKVGMVVIWISHDPASMHIKSILRFCHKWTAGPIHFYSAHCISLEDNRSTFRCNFFLTLWKPREDNWYHSKATALLKLF